MTNSNSELLVGGGRAEKLERKLKHMAGTRKAANDRQSSWGLAPSDGHDGKLSERDG